MGCDLIDGGVCVCVVMMEMYDVVLWWGARVLAMRIRSFVLVL